MARKSRNSRGEKEKPSFFDSYWFEFAVVSLLGFGIFLLFEQLEIKAAIYDFVVRTGGGAWTYIRITGRAVRDWIREVKTSNLVGISLIVIAFVLMFWKLRLRALKRHPHISLCPECGADLHRIRTTFRQKLQQFFLWIRINHYSCCKCPFRTAVWRSKTEH